MGILSAPRYPPLVTVSPWSLESLGGSLSAVDVAYMPPATPAAFSFAFANYVSLIPFVLDEPATFVKMMTVNGSPVSGNVDVGIYDEKGTRLVSSGSTVQTGTNTLQVFDIADTRIGPGRFYLAMSCDNTTAVFVELNPSSFNHERVLGVRSASAFPLPATLALGSAGVNIVPLVAATTRTLV